MMIESEKKVFPDLTFLDCGNNQLVNLNISQNVLLERVLCRYNQILYLDITNNTALYSLYCHDNQLISLDVSNNPDLTFLACGNNRNDIRKKKRFNAPRVSEACGVFGLMDGYKGQIGRDRRASNSRA